MTRMELQFLEEIWRNGGKANIHLLARKLGASPNYILTVPKCGLYKKYFVRRVSSNRFQITPQGLEALVTAGKIKKTLFRKPQKVVSKPRKISRQEKPYRGPQSFKPPQILQNKTWADKSIQVLSVFNKPKESQNVEFEDNNGDLPEKNMVGNKKIEKTAGILRKIFIALYNK